MAGGRAAILAGVGDGDAACGVGDYLNGLPEIGVLVGRFEAEAGTGRGRDCEADIAVSAGDGGEADVLLLVCKASW